MIRKLIRLLLNLIPDNTIIPIITGKNKGKLWIKNSGVNGYWFGNYEKEKQKLFFNELRNSDIVYDMGANVGFYSLLASKCKKVYSFEPLKENLSFLKKHIELNKLDNVEIKDFALSNFSGKTYFDKGENNFVGKISKSGYEIECKKLDDLDIKAPTIMKIDVEGEELNVLEGGVKLLKKYKPRIFLAIHTEELKDKCLNFLHNIGYQNFKNINGEFYIY